MKTDFREHHTPKHSCLENVLLFIQNFFEQGLVFTLNITNSKFNTDLKIKKAGEIMSLTRAIILILNYFNNS